MPYYNGDPKRDHDFDNHPYGDGVLELLGLRMQGTAAQTSLRRRPNPACLSHVSNVFFVVEPSKIVFLI